MNNENILNNDFNNNNDDNIDDLDTTWLQEFETLNNDYKNYYTEDLSFIRIHTIYVNNDNDIEKVREEKVLLKTPGILLKEELLGIIKHNCFSNGIKYSLLSILKFNINIEPIHLKTFLKSKNTNIGSSFLQSIKNIDSIKFEKSISMFHDINDLVIIFHKKNTTNLLSGSTFTSTSLTDIKNRTKKVFINHNSKKKTRRKELKDTSI
jgi:hypothetical protein